MIVYSCVYVVSEALEDELFSIVRLSKLQDQEKLRKLNDLFSHHLQTLTILSSFIALSPVFSFNTTASLSIRTSPSTCLNMATAHGSTISIVPSEILRQVARSLVSKDERYIAVQAITTKANVVASYRSSQR